jgi:hypothetical protein
MNHVIDEDLISESFDLIDDTDDRPALVLPRPRAVDDLDRWNLAPVPRRSRRPLEVSF